MVLDSKGPPCGNPDDNVGCVPTKGDYLVSITFQYSYIIGYCSGDNPRCLPQKHNPQISMYIQPEWQVTTQSTALPQHFFEKLATPSSEHRFEGGGGWRVGV